MTEFGFYLRRGWPLAIIFAVAVAAFYINHTITAGYKNKISVAERELAAMKMEIALSPQRADEYLRAKAVLSTYLEFMHVKNEPQMLIDRVESDALIYHVKLNDVQIDIPKFFKDRSDSRTIVPVTFQAAFTGGYFNMGKFLGEFEKRPYLHRIDEANVTANSPDGTEIKLTIKGALRIFDKSIVEWCMDNES
jgi:hypothetical protein